MPNAQIRIRNLSEKIRSGLQSAVSMSVVVTARLWRVRFADQMKPLGQTDARRNVLAAIASASSGVNQSELAQQLGIQSPTLVRLLDGLEKQGLVKRLGTTDRRAKLVSIEPKGHEMLAALNGFASKLQNEIFSDVSDADLTTTARVLDNMNNHLGPSQAET